PLTAGDSTNSPSSHSTFRTAAERSVTPRVSDGVGRDCLSSAGVRVGSLPARPRSSGGRAPDRTVADRTFRTAPSLSPMRVPRQAGGDLADGQTLGNPG